MLPPDAYGRTKFVQGHSPWHPHKKLDFSARPCKCGCGSTVVGRKEYVDRTHRLSAKVHRHCLRRRERAKTRPSGVWRAELAEAFRRIGVLRTTERNALLRTLRAVWKRITKWATYVGCSRDLCIAPDPLDAPLYHVYGLIDPRNRLVRYIGLSTLGVRRPQAHRRPSSRTRKYHSARWVADLARLGLTFEITVLEPIWSEDYEALCRAECRWIAYGWACGWPLTNLTRGGDGAKGLVKPPEERERMRERSRALWRDSTYRARVLRHPKTQLNSAQARDNALRRWRDPKYKQQQKAVLKHAGDKARRLHGSPMKDPSATDLVRLQRQLVIQGVCKRGRMKRVNRRRLWNLLFSSGNFSEISVQVVDPEN